MRKFIYSTCVAVSFFIMDKDIEKLLESWQLDQYIPIFAANKITIETLGLLESKDIKELIGPIGDRVKFEKNVAQWNELTNAFTDHDCFVTKLRHSTPSEYENIFGLHLEPNNQPSHSTSIHNLDDKDNSLDDISNLVLIPTPSTSSITIHQPSSPPESISDTASTSTQISTNSPVSNKYTRLKDLLNESIEGKVLLNLSSESGLLSSNGRRKICNIIVKHILHKDPLERISGSTLLEYAQQITSIFKQENICTYFVPYISNNKLKVRRLAKGKLYDCLQNRKREYREAMQNTHKKNAQESNQIINRAPTGDNEDLEWLKNSCDPWDTVAEKWTKTFEPRRAEIMKESSTIDAYMKNYPALQKPAKI